MDYQARHQARQAALRERNEACETGDLERIRQLFGNSQSGSNKDTSQDRTPQDDMERQHEESLIGPDDAFDCLVWMVDEDDLRVSRCLLELGIIDLHNPKRPIRLVTSVKSHAMLELLAEFGFDFGQYGHNILHKFLTPISTLKYLLDLGADPNKPVAHSLIWFLKVGERDETIQCLNEAAAQGNIPAFELLVSYGADPKRSLALHRATRYMGPGTTNTETDTDTEGNREKGKEENKTTVTEMINYLVDVHGLDPNADDKCGGLRKVVTPFHDDGTPLEAAFGNQNREAAVALFRKGADLERILDVNKSKKIDELKRFIEGEGV